MVAKVGTTAFMGNGTFTGTLTDVREKAVPSRRLGKLLHKLLIVFLLLSLVPLLMATFLLVRLGDRIKGQIVDAKAEIAQKVASNVWLYLEEKKNTLQVIHKSSDFLTMNPLRQSEILNN